MPVERPSQHTIQTFIATQEAKKKTGEWGVGLPSIVFAGTAYTLFFTTLYWSLTPTGIVSRILYEKTLSVPRRRLRHFAPALVVLGTMFIWDVANGVWSDSE